MLNNNRTFTHYNTSTYNSISDSGNNFSYRDNIQKEENTEQTDKLESEYSNKQTEVNQNPIEKINIENI